MIKKIFLCTVLAASTALLGACSNSGDTDPYALVTLKQVTQGQVVSKQFKYKFQNPKIVTLNRNVGLIRDGGQMEFIVARSLEEKLKDHMDGDIELAVVKRFTPFVHFRVERIVAQGDTMFPAQAGSIAYPHITTPEQYGVDSFEERAMSSIAFNDTQGLQRLKDKKFRVKAPITVEMVEGQPQYMLVGEKAKLRLADAPDGTGLILKLLAEKNYIFEGGVSNFDIENFGDRSRNRVAGTVNVDFVMYGNRLVTG